MALQDNEITFNCLKNYYNKDIDSKCRFFHTEHECSWYTSLPLALDSDDILFGSTMLSSTSFM